MRAAAAGGLLIVAALAGALAPGRARACSFAGPSPHTIDSALVGVDQTPPTLPQPVVAEINHNESEGCGASNSCHDIVSARITNLATDDTTSSDQIGYRFAVVAGTRPAGFSLPDGTARMPIYDGSFSLYWTAGEDVDVTLTLFAVDAAGNQSAARTLRIHDDLGGCSVGRNERRGVLTLAIMALVLAAAARRRPGRHGAMGALVILVAVAAVISPSRARACDPLQGPSAHVVDPATVGVDEVAPVLAQPQVVEITRGDDDGCVMSKCANPSTIVINAAATDDTTPADAIGYRFAVAGGALPGGLALPAGAVDTPFFGGTFRFNFDAGNRDDIDFTLQVIAVDAAGNESAPQTVRVHDDTGGCSVGRGHPAVLSFAVVMLALGIAARRPRQRRRLRR
jgi:hypothetical protein